MLSSDDDKAAEASKRQDIFFLYFISALDYFHLYNLEHFYKRYAVKNFKVFVALNADCRDKRATGFAFKRGSAAVMLNPKIRYIT